MKSPWQIWKEHDAERVASGQSSPLDFLNPGTEYVSAEVATSRFSVCEGCPDLIKVTSQCKKCGCFMKLKVKIAHAECPVGKW